MTHRHQRGWLKKEKRGQGETWVLFFRTVRKSDGKRVENKIPIGLVKDFSDKSCVWAEVERQHIHINQVDFRGCVRLRIWHITMRNMSSSNPPNRSIQRHTRRSGLTSECSAIDCCHTGGTGLRSASNRWTWSNG
jgi:hypothetical protein